MKHFNLPEKFNIPKYSHVIKFHVLNFCCFDYPQKFFNSEFLPIYGIYIYIYNIYIYIHVYICIYIIYIIYIHIIYIYIYIYIIYYIL